MSRNSAEVVRGAYEAFARGDIAFVVEALDPNVEWNEAESFIYAEGNPYIGPNAVLEGIFKRLGSEWDGFSASPEEVLDVGETVVARGYYSGVYKGTGKATSEIFATRISVGTDFKQYDIFG